MLATRRMRLQSVIQDELSQVIAREVKDPRVPPITITGVEVTQDGGQATISISILGGLQGGLDGAPPLSEQAAAKRMKECITGLGSATGYLKRHLAKVLKVRQIPHLIFREDRGFENSIRIEELLKQL